MQNAVEQCLRSALVDSTRDGFSTVPGIGHSLACSDVALPGGPKTTQ